MQLIVTLSLSEEGEGGGGEEDEEEEEGEEEELSASYRWQRGHEDRETDGHAGTKTDRHMDGRRTGIFLLLSLFLSSFISFFH